ncbi:MAG: hypothetical protein JNM69_29335 [Archangium sp.]|nr:hypothetical protein [Archangium sp.]
MRRLLISTLLFFAACKPAAQLGGMRVVVSVDEGANISCVEISAESLDTRTILTSQADVANRPVLQVGITETPSFSGRVKVTVRGFAKPGCLEAPSVVLPPQEGVLGPPPFETPLEFRFRKAPVDGGVADAGVDAGVDAGSFDAGRPDAGTDAGVTCDMASCSSSNECETAACGPSDSCARMFRAAATPCDGGVCNGAGACLAPTGCVPGAACDAGLSCTTNGTCSDAGVCVPSFAGCVAPACMRRLDLCAADGGCAFELDPSRIATACGAGSVCYANGECQPFLRAANVSAARAPWPSSPIVFRADGGSCTYGWNTTPGPVGAPLAGVPCGWPAGLEPVVLPQQGNGPEVIAFVGTSLVVESGVNLRFLGRRPVVFLIHGDALIEGLVNLRPISPAFPGAGADSAACGLGGVGAAAAREGGGGGGYLDMGGAGGRTSSSNGGAANGNAAIEPLRGGCSGGAGWNGTDAGLAGGGLQISVRGALRILDGGIAAPATGGPGGVAGSAAGGGGSGGAILLQALTVLVQNGFLTANGGAGGEGGTNRNGVTANGDAGADGAFRTAVPATGGNNGNCCGGNGGPGGAGMTAPGDGTNGVMTSSNEPGGGGGGGSRGRIRIDTASGGSCTLTQSVISPTDNLQGPNTTCITN